MSEPITELDARYGEPDAGPTSWTEAQRTLEAAELYWVTTVRPQGGPHITPLVGVHHDGTLRFTTGADERKGRNLAANPRCAMSTGCNTLHAGLDVVVEGVAERITDDAVLRATAAAFLAKYGDEWRFEVADGVFVHGGGRAVVFELRPTVAYAFAKSPYSHTRYRF